MGVYQLKGLVVLLSSVRIIEQVVHSKGKAETFVWILVHKEGSIEVFSYLTSYSLQRLFDLMLSIAHRT